MTGCDDWTGVADAAARKRIQTRLNMRAMRRLKAEEARTKNDVKAESEHVLRDEDGTTLKTIPCWHENEQCALHMSQGQASQLPIHKEIYRSRTRDVIIGPPCPWHQIEKSESPPSFDVGQKTVILPLSPDHLISLLQFNALRAVWTNRQLLVRLDALRSSSSAASYSKFSSIQELPGADALTSVPPSLLPTRPQLAYPTRPLWLDIIPHPGWRDNLLLALGTYNIMELANDTIGGLFTGFPADEIKQRGIVARSPPWDVSGWEVSEGFWHKWRWSFVGCEEEVLRATNPWMRLRGEDDLRR